MYTKILIGTICAVALASAARAEVVSSADNGFTIRHSVAVTLPPTAAWAGLVDVGRWWDPSHSYSGDTRNLTLDPSVGGCLCEKWGFYNSVQHMSVVHSRPAKLLRLNGALGPLQQFAVTGILTWDLEASGGGSRITMTYTVGGYSGQSLGELASVVNDVMVIQVERLGRFIATGSPDAAKPEPKVEPKK